MDAENNTHKDEIEELEHESFEYEVEDEIVEEGGLQDKLKKLRIKLKEQKAKTTEYLTGWQKERADFANYKAEEEKNRKDRLSLMKTNLIADFFPVLDSFDMAFSNKEAWEKVDPAWRTGVEYIHSQFMNVFDSYGVTTIDQANVAFDPVIHDPTDVIETEDETQVDTVAQIIQKGYRQGDLVIRPAKVKTYSPKK